MQQKYAAQAMACCESEAGESCASSAVGQQQQQQMLGSMAQQFEARCCDRWFRQTLNVEVGSSCAHQESRHP